MCGIVGAVAQRNIVSVLVEGLRRLEYRGYDSCGVAVIADGEPKRARSVERVSDLADQVRDTHLEGETGIAHTRWATHGAPVTTNAHPIFSSNEVALVHNGIVENYESLREMLRGKGYEFVSQTDTEVIAHLIHSMYQGDLFQTVRDAVRLLHGAYAIAVVHKAQPHTVVGARQGSPLVVGLGDGENFLASDALALAGSTDRFSFLDEGDVVEITLDGVKIADREGMPAQREVRVVAAYGGRYLARGGAVEVLEGDASPQRVALVEFPDMARLKAFYHSAEYQALKAIRSRASHATFTAIEGV